ncbi:GNAT family N-acetyltransferase [Dyella amyloliquefaciens]|uniref:GNAT family N-acetyltransferase n=1 Tax=Dyella amyloliquefaciens TaxID=1770545 RepID=UPI00102EB0C6|nr:GNAT family protein [Dyella amyloliquefaciens]
MELETSRLRLDALHPVDATVLFRYRSDPEVARYQGWQPVTLADADRFIGNQSATPAPGTWFQRAIRLRDGALIGDLGFCLSGDGLGEFGITVAPEHQGKGFAREAVQVLLGELFGRLDVHRVHASVDPRNEPCMALMRALGLRQEAHFRESFRHRGEWVDDVVFAMLAREWREIAANSAAVPASR